MTAARTKVKPPSSISVTYSVVSQGVFVAKVGWTPQVSAWPVSYYVLYKDGEELAASLSVTTYRDEAVIEGEDVVYSVSTVNVNETEGSTTPPAATSIPSYPIWDTDWSLLIDQNTTSNISSRASDPQSLPLTFSRQGGTAPGGVTISSAGVVSVGSSTAGAYTAIFRASNGLLSSDTTVSLTVNAVISAPNLPQDFAASVSDDDIHLSWSAPSGGVAVTDYNADVSSTGSSGPWTALTPLTGPSVFSYDYNNVADGTYDFRLEARAGSVSSGFVFTQATVNTAVTPRRQPFARADFNSGQVINQPTTIGNSAARLGNGLLIQTLPINQSGFESIGAGASNTAFGVNSIYDTHCITAETVSETDTQGVLRTDNVTPRAGTHCLRAKIYRAQPHTDMGTPKHYEGLNNTSAPPHNQDKCKPRVSLAFANQTAYGFEWDTEIWFGWSIYIPRSFQHESNRTGDTGNGPQFLSIFPQDTTMTHFSFHALVPTAGDNWRNASNGQLVTATDLTHWCMIINTNANAASESGATVRKISLGSIVPYMGAWTDIVFRLRFNPFTTAQTVAGYPFAANAGVVQAWLGPSGTLAEGSPAYSSFGPCGLRPPTTGSKLAFHPRVYFFGVRSDIIPAENDRTHPHVFFFDEIRWGYGTGPKVALYQPDGAMRFSDVVPQ